MPFVALETSTKDNKNLKRHILSFVDHTLPMFRMSVTNKKANTLVKEMCDTMPKEFHDTVHAKRIWFSNQDETIKLYMSSPNFLRKVSLHVEPADKDQFICKSISELALEIMDAFSNARQPLGTHYSDYRGSVQKIVTAAVRFGTRPFELAKQPIECHLGSLEEKLRALSHGNTYVKEDLRQACQILKSSPWKL